MNLTLEKLMPVATGVLLGAAAVAIAMILLKTFRGPTAICTLNILCIKTNSVANAAPQQIHIATPVDGARDIVVSWETSGPVEQSRLEYRPAGQENWQTTDVVSKRAPANGILGSRQWLHQARMTPLTPETVYEYRIRSQGRFSRRTYESELYRAKTLDDPIKYPLSIALVTDTGLAGRADRLTPHANPVLARLIDQPAHLILGLGDYPYADSDERFLFPEQAIGAWLREWQPVLAQTPFYPQWGNHECCLRETTDLWTPRFELPESDSPDGLSYTFQIGNVFFLSLFSPGVEGLTPNAYMLSWMDEVLSTAREGGALWLIVYQHEPIYAHGQAHPADPETRAALAPIFEKHKVDLHLSSHDQSYERTYPLNGVTRDEFSIGSQEVNEYRQGQGVIYAKVSPSGKKSNITGDFSHLPPEKMPMIAVANDKAHHFGVLELRSPEELALVVYAVDDTRTYDVLDVVTIRVIP